MLVVPLSNAHDPLMRHGANRRQPILPSQVYIGCTNEPAGTILDIL